MIGTQKTIIAIALIFAFASLILPITNPTTPQNSAQPIGLKSGTCSRYVGGENIAIPYINGCKNKLINKNPSGKIAGNTNITSMNKIAIPVLILRPRSSTLDLQFLSFS